jgi:hypothetical protein
VDRISFFFEEMAYDLDDVLLVVDDEDVDVTRVSSNRHGSQAKSMKETTGEVAVGA